MALLILGWLKKETDFNINCCATQDAHTSSVHEFECIFSSWIIMFVPLTPGDSYLLLVVSVSAPQITEVFSFLCLTSQNPGHQTFDEMRAHGRTHTLKEIKLEIQFKNLGLNWLWMLKNSDNITLDMSESMYDTAIVHVYTDTSAHQEPCQKISHTAL